MARSARSASGSDLCYDRHSRTVLTEAPALEGSGASFCFWGWEDALDTRTEAHFWTHVLQHVGLFLAGLALMIVVLWLVLAEQKTKLYEADNVVCASQPFAMQCFQRKPR